MGHGMCAHSGRAAGERHAHQTAGTHRRADSARIEVEMGMESEGGGWGRIEVWGNERFTEVDLNGLSRAKLVELVQAQLHLWPTASKVTPNLHIASIPPVIINAEASHVDEEPSLDNVALEAMNREDLPRESRSIILLIEDTRHFFNEKISQRVEVQVIDSEGGKTRVGAKDVITALQASISAFEGPARLGTPDAENPEFTKFFGTLEGTKYVAFDEHTPELLVVPRDGRLEITVALYQGVKSSVKEEKPDAPPLPDPFTQFEEFAKTEQVRLAASSAATRVKKKPPQPLTSDELDWLIAKVQAMDGCETFQKQHNQRLSNHDRVLYWKFAADFAQKYYQKEWPIFSTENSNGTLIRKHALQTVLNMKATGLNQAINMSRILVKCYHGATKSPEVVKLVDDTTSVSLGSEPLVNSLLQWDKDHRGFGGELD
ncbi:hypothetical protein C8F04DRAFT_1338865 [Mycena alexandri]|uniref:Uncharacterized protein n=1 Tax=Mycena alexandri TaxID=1745969 RepID=A0AAD6SYP2_9AGAR|nr:hypothetical protein C8F04DRAFT_1338865 [Mycena alexandri]